MDHKTDTDRGRDALIAYLKDCDDHAIVPDVGGAFHAAFIAGRASLAANAGSEPVASYAIRMLVAAGHITQAKADESLRLAAEFTHPSPPEGMVGGLQVYRCKIKSRKQIDREIPREQQGWWADVAAGQKLLLRQAVQSDLDRCTLGGKRSRNPADYMCETHTNGSLVSKVALEYMNPEQNVFAAPPTSVDSRKGDWHPLRAIP